MYDVGSRMTGRIRGATKADKLGPLDAHCAALLFENQPEQLRHFQRMMESGRFTVFRVLTSP